MTDLSLSVNNLAEYSLYESLLSDDPFPPRVSFIELFWDNFCHLDPKQLREWITPLADRVALHIMWSRFIDISQKRLTGFLETLHKHVEVLDPLYVSDHYAAFRFEGMHSFVAVERAYDNLQEVATRVRLYQEAIGQQLLLENFASNTESGNKQPEYLQALCAESGAGLLFDISNAWVAELNGFCPLEAWDGWLSYMHTLRCHIGGFEYSLEDRLYHDSHAAPIDPRPLATLQKYSDQGKVASVVYERDYRKYPEGMRHDLIAISAGING